MFGFFILVNLLLANQAVLGFNSRINGGFLEENFQVGSVNGGSDNGGEVVLDFRPVLVSAPMPTPLATRVRDILSNRSHRKSTKYKQALDLLARSIDAQDARAEQEAKDRRRDSCCNCLATAVNTGIAIAGLGVAVWVATGNKEKQD